MSPQGAEAPDETAQPTPLRSLSLVRGSAGAMATQRMVLLRWCCDSIAICQRQEGRWKTVFQAFVRSAEHLDVIDISAEEVR